MTEIEAIQAVTREQVGKAFNGCWICWSPYVTVWVDYGDGNQLVRCDRCGCVETRRPVQFVLPAFPTTAGEVGV